MSGLPLVITFLTTRVVLAPPPLPEDTGACGEEARCSHVALCTPSQGGRHTSAGAGAGCSSPSTVGWAQITEGTRRTEAATRQIPSSAVNPLRQGGACVGPKCRVSQWSMSDSAEGLSQSFQEAGGPPPYTRIAQPLVRPLVHLLPYPGLKFRSCPPPNSIGYRGVCSPSPRM